MSEKIFITGATGLVGSHAARHLAQAGYTVVAAVRSPEKAQALAVVPGITPVTVGLDDKQRLRAAMSGCAAVVHCAGAVDPHARREAIFATNVDGTRNVLHAAMQAGVKHFVHISSLSVITGQEDQFDVDELAPLRYCGEAYGDSKVEAEKVVLAEARDLDYTILRPGFIYGPGERAWLPRLINNLRTGKAMLIDGGTRATNVIYIGNLVKAIELSLFNPRAHGQVYNLTDGATPSKKELFDAVCDGLALPRVKKSVPRFVAKAVCDTVSVLAPALPADTRQTLSRFSRAAFRLAGINQGFNISKAERELGYVDRVPFAQGMAQTLKSFSVQAPAEQTAAAATGGKR